MSNSEIKELIPLSKMHGKKGRFITIALIISFIFNVLALTVPFTEVGHFLSSPVSCTLPYSVYLMWVEGLYLIAILIVGFSIIFPFAKLFVLFYIWLIETDSNRRHKFLSIVEPLGKWSMLDVFATCIILILCSRQILIYGTPMIGADFFLAAIFISLITSIIISHLQDKKENKPLISDKIKLVSSMSKLSRFFVILMLLISLAALIIAIWAPYIEITSFLLIGYEYSIFGSVISLSDQALILSLFMFFTLIVFPLLHIVSMLVYVIIKFSSNKRYPKLVSWIKIFSRFNMLDVFLLAFIIFISEGKALIKTHEKAGLYLICIFIFTSSVFPYIVMGIKKHVAGKIKNK
jgi:paraquat-inducible protein A